MFRAIIIITVINIMSFVYTCASQDLTVCIMVDTSRRLRRQVIPSDQLEKWGRFFGRQALPFETYCPVVSALYKDHLSDGAAFVSKNFINEVPFIICNDIGKNQREQYLFPKFISKSFIVQLQEKQLSGKSFHKKIYKNKNTKATVTVRYIIELLEKTN